MADGSRPKILSILRDKGQASAEQLAQELGLASTTVRRHLDILQRDHLVDLRQSRAHAGRPQNQYFLTEAGLESQPKGYGRLLLLLMEELSALNTADTSGLDGKGLSRLLFTSMAHRLAFRSSSLPAEDHEGRFLDLLQWLQDKDFQPEAERMDGAVRITLRNCPFRLVAMANEGVCLFDQTVISRLLNVPVTRERCIRGSDRVCCYVADVNWLSTSSRSS